MKTILFLLLLSQALWAFNNKEFCSGVVQCTEIKPQMCTDSLSVKNEDIIYNDAFCSLYEDISKRGIKPNTNLHMQLYADLGLEYRVEYIVEGSLPISKEMMSLLLSDIPNTALLINAYQETEYSASYTTFDRNTFKGSNGGSLRGTVSVIADDVEKRELTYYGFGVADVLFWSLKGPALFFLEYASVSHKQITYRLRIIVFNRSSIINGIMDLGIFRSVVASKIETIINHIQKSAREYAKGNYKPITDYPLLNTEQGKKFLKKIEMVDTQVPVDTLKKEINE